jgi:hypothetical protein
MPVPEVFKEALWLKSNQFEKQKAELTSKLHPISPSPTLGTVVTWCDMVRALETAHSACGGEGRKELERCVSPQTSSLPCDWDCHGICSRHSLKESKIFNQ